MKKSKEVRKEKMSLKEFFRPTREKIINWLLLVGFLIPSVALAMMPPSYKECRQRGYDVNVEHNIPYCIFPDDSKCRIEDFNEGICGAEFKIEDYCVKKGVSVWDKDKCCPGLRPYLSPFVIGHPSCQPFYKAMVSSPYFWFIIMGIGFLIFWLIRKKNEHKN